MRFSISHLLLSISSVLAGWIIPVWAYSQVTIPSGQYGLDDSTKLIICNVYPESIPANTSEFVFNQTYTLISPINSIQVGTKYQATAPNNDHYSIYFTDIPIIQIGVSHIDHIEKSSEIQGNLKIIDPKGQPYDSPIGIKVRGNTSATFPKKSYRVQLRDNLGVNKDTTLFGFRSDKRWLMLAVMNEKIRLNNKISHDLWLKMHTLYYKAQEPTAQSTIRSVYVEAFVNNRYRGVYLFTENTDRKQLQLKKTRDNGTVRGELYKGDDHGNTQFISLPSKPSSPSEVWGSWEVSYPDVTDWNNLFDLTQFVKESNNSVFTSGISERVKMSNMSDYFIFLNLLRASDNTGKNTFLAKYKENEPYFYTVWDLDGTWGYDWTGERQTDVNEILSNMLFSRLAGLNPNQYRHKTAERWFNLRDNLLHIDSLYENIDNQYDLLAGNGVYQREKLLWSMPNNISAELSYLKNWLQLRVNRLDNYFNSWVESCTAPTLSIDKVAYTNGERVTLIAQECYGVTKWYENPTGTTFLAKGNSFLTPPLYSSKTYYASCTIGNCESSVRTPIIVNPNCSENPLSYNDENQLPADYSSDNVIQSRATIIGTTQYNSGKYILLLPGFETAPEKIFKAIIQGCN
jgi:hypothetical protein